MFFCSQGQQSNKGSIISGYWFFEGKEDLMAFQTIGKTILWLVSKHRIMQGDLTFAGKIIILEKREKES